MARIDLVRGDIDVEAAGVSPPPAPGASAGSREVPMLRDMADARSHRRWRAPRSAAWSAPAPLQGGGGRARPPETPGAWHSRAATTRPGRSPPDRGPPREVLRHRSGGQGAEDGGAREDSHRPGRSPHRGRPARAVVMLAPRTYVRSAAPARRHFLHRGGEQTAAGRGRRPERVIPAHRRGDRRGARAVASPGTAAGRLR